MPTQLTGGGTATSFTNTPQAKDDTYLYLEDLLRANSTLYNSYTNTILLDVMSNDLGGGAKALFSVYEGDGDLLDDDFELLVKDVDASGASPWERTQGDNWVRINNGKIEFRIAKPGDNDPDHALSIDSLTDGQNFVDEFVYAIRLGNGTLSEAIVRINITGAQDNATVVAAPDGDYGVTEAGGVANGTPGDPSAHGQLLITDADLGENHFQTPASLDGTYGKFTFDPTTGAWTYLLDNSRPATEGLDDGDVVSDSLTVTSADGTASHTITVTINGTDDQPTLAAVTAGSLAEVDQSSATTPLGLSGVLSGTDVDGDTLTYGVVGGTLAAGVSTLASAYGTLSVNTASGAYNFVPNSAIEGLDDGETATVNFTMAVSDGDGPSVTQTYTITLTGADDAPTLAAVTAGSVVEVPNSTSTTDSGLTGNLVGADVDVETLTYGIVGGTVSAGVATFVGTYGTLTVNTFTGAYAYTKNAAAIEALNTGQNPSDTFTVTVSDGDGPTVNQTYTVNITGADDALAQNVITNLALGTGIVIPEYALLYTGGFGSGDISGVSSPVGGTVTHTPGTGTLGNVTFTDTAPAGGSFAYTTTTPVATTTVAVSQDTVGTIDGTSGNDILISANGGATLQGNGGNDVLLGGSGNDTYVFGLNDGNDVITDSGSGNDQIIITTSTPLNSTSINTLNFEQTSLNLAINVGNTLIVVRDQYAGTGEEIESVTFSNGGTIYGYQLNTTGYRLSTDTTSPLSEGGNEDIIASTSGGQTLNGGGANDLLFGNGGNDTINGDKGNDLIMAGDGTDTIDGGDDNDTIVGQGGADSLTGGSGTDTFVLTDAATFDTITDYAAGEIIDITTLLTTVGSLSGFVRLTAAGDLQLDANGGGDSFVTIAHINTAAVNATVTYSTGPGTTATVTVVRGAPPIGIDLDGDGQVSFLATDAGATFDYGAGLVHTAWVAGNDGILVRDANHDGQASATEIVFATSGSDLQGLAVYDSNHDGQLSSADAAFADFEVWQDANSNGVVDNGEMNSLMALGITSISLTSDGIGYSAAGGDVSVVGTGSFTWANGSTGVLADAVFATGAAVAQQEQKQALSSANSNAALIGAIAAAGLVAAEPLAAAQTHSEGHLDANGLIGASLHTQALAPTAIDKAGISGAGELLQSNDQVQPLVKSGSDTAPANSEGQAKTQLDSSSAAHDRAPAESDHGTEAPVHNAVVAQVPLVAQGVAMPSAEMLKGAANTAGPIQHNAVVEQVLADALNGGGQGPDIDSLLGSLSTNGSGTPHGLSMLHGPVGLDHLAAMVPQHFAMVEPVIHHDAPPVA